MGDSLWESHKDFKINRYYCPICKHTHTASYGKIFLTHLKHKGKEIEYYGDICIIKVKQKALNNICLTNEEANEIDRFMGELTRLNFSYHRATEWEKERLKKEYEELKIKYNRYMRKIKGNSDIKPLRLTSKLSSYSMGIFTEIPKHFNTL
jgi:hypothetical protein